MTTSIPSLEQSGIQTTGQWKRNLSDNRQPIASGLSLLPRTCPHLSVISPHMFRQVCPSPHSTCSLRYNIPLCSRTTYHPLCDHLLRHCIYNAYVVATIYCDAGKLWEFGQDAITFVVPVNSHCVHTEFTLLQLSSLSNYTISTGSEGPVNCTTAQFALSWGPKRSLSQIPINDCSAQ